MALPELGLFDPAAELVIDYRRLPHWFQPGVSVFITFRTADSMPAHVIRRWKDEQRQWLRDRGWKIEDSENLPASESLPIDIRREYQKYRDRQWHESLDACHGACVFRRRDLAEIVLNSLRHFDGQRYDLDCAIIMPNHVHLIAQFRLPVTCRKQSASWLHFTSHEIHKQIGGSGAFWQGEPFDHLIRTVEQFEYLRVYIANNGRKAGLPKSDVLYWQQEYGD